MRILSEAMMNDPMMTQNLSDLFTEENLAELSAMVRGNMYMGTLLWPSRYNTSDKIRRTGIGTSLQLRFKVKNRRPG